MSESKNPNPLRRQGWFLVGCSIAMLAVVLHHPTGHGHGGLSDFVDGVQRGAWLNRAVHGSLIALIVGVGFGLSSLAVAVDKHRFAGPLAAIAYGIGVLQMVLAAMLSGFVTTEFAKQVGAVDEAKSQAIEAAFQLIHVGNQVCATFGSIGLGLGAALCGWALLSSRSPYRRIGYLGALVGGLTLVGLASGHLQMDVHGMIVISASNLAWSLSAATVMIRSGGIPMNSAMNSQSPAES